MKAQKVVPMFDTATQSYPPTGTLTVRAWIDFNDPSAPDGTRARMVRVVTEHCMGVEKAKARADELRAANGSLQLMGRLTIDL